MKFILLCSYATKAIFSGLVFYFEKSVYSAIIRSLLASDWTKLSSPSTSQKSNLFRKGHGCSMVVCSWCDPPQLFENRSACWYKRVRYNVYLTFHRLPAKNRTNWSSASSTTYLRDLANEPLTFSSVSITFSRARQNAFVDFVEYRALKFYSHEIG